MENNNITKLSYEEACETLKHIIDVDFPIETEINDVFVNESLSPYIGIGETSYTSNIKNALVIVFKQAIKNTQEQKRKIKIDTSAFAIIDENQHKFINKDDRIGQQQITNTIPNPKEIVSSIYEWETKNYKKNTDNTKKDILVKSIQKREQINKTIINKNPNKEVVDNIVKRTQGEAINTLDTDMVTKINNLLEKLKNTNEKYDQNTIGQEIYVMIQDIYPIGNILLKKFREDYIFKAEKVNGILLKLGLSGQRSNTAIKNIIADLTKRSK